MTSALRAAAPRRGDARGAWPLALLIVGLSWGCEEEPPLLRPVEGDWDVSQRQVQAPRDSGVVAPPRDAGREVDGPAPVDAAPGDAALPPALADAETGDTGVGAADAGDPDTGPEPFGCQLDGCSGQQRCEVDGRCSEPASCSHDRDCLANRICENAVCTRPCGQGIGCAAGQRCEPALGRCREPASCAAHPDCLAGRVCVDGQCEDAPAPGCEADLDCPAGQACAPEVGRCEGVHWCAGDEDCSGPASCVPGLGCVGCEPEAECGEGAECGQDGFASNHSALAAILLQPRRTTGFQLCGEEVDWYRIDVPAGQGAELVFYSDPAVLDLLLRVYDSAADGLLARLDHPAGYERFILGHAAVDSRLWFALSSSDGRSGSYGVDFSLRPGGACPDDSGELQGGDDRRELARPRPFGEHRGWRCPGDEDWSVFEVGEDGAGTVMQLDLSPSGVGGSPLELELRGGDDDLLGRGAGLDLRDPVAGPYRVGVVEGAGGYSLHAHVATAEVLAACEAAEGLPVGQVVAGQTSGIGVLTPSCGDPAAGPEAPEKVLVLDLEQPSDLRISLADATDFDATVSLTRSCGNPHRESLCLHGPGAELVHSLPAGRWYVIVDGYAGGSGEFQISAELQASAPPPVETRCSEAPLLDLSGPDGLRIEGSLSGATDDHRGEVCPASGAEVFYRFELAEESFLSVEAVGDELLSFTLLEDCPPGRQRSCSGPGEVLEVNRLAPGSYWLAVEAPNREAEGPFSLFIRTTAPLDLDTCSGAVEVGSGGRFEATTLGAVNDYRLPAQGCTGYPTNGADHSYRVRLEAGQRLVATLESAWDAALYLVSDCEAPAESCVGGVDDYLEEGPAERLDLVAPLAGGYFLIVDASVGAGQGDYRLEVVVEPECELPGDCPAELACELGRCRSGGCVVDGDCRPLEACRGNRCEPSTCAAHADCSSRGGYCTDQGWCSSPPGQAVGTGHLDLLIPDDDGEGVTASLVVDGPGVIEELFVSLLFDHPAPTDLVIELRSPAGRTVRLYNQSSAQAGVQHLVYGVSSVADGPGRLQDLVGSPANGLWQLTARDLAPGDTGSVLAFGLTVMRAP